VRRRWEEVAVRSKKSKSPQAQWRPVCCMLSQTTREEQIDKAGKQTVSLGRGRGEGVGSWSGTSTKTRTRIRTNSSGPKKKIYKHIEGAGADKPGSCREQGWPNKEEKPQVCGNRCKKRRRRTGAAKKRVQKKIKGCDARTGLKQPIWEMQTVWHSSWSRETCRTPRKRPPGTP